MHRVIQRRILGCALLVAACMSACSNGSADAGAELGGAPGETVAGRSRGGHGPSGGSSATSAGGASSAGAGGSAANAGSTTSGAGSSASSGGALGTTGGSGSDASGGGSTSGSGSGNAGANATGGASGGSTSNPTSPTAKAGPEQTVVAGTMVTLDGSGSVDPHGAALTYSWTQVSGTSVVLSDATSATPTFTAPAVTSAQQLTFHLIVHNATEASAPASAAVTVTPPTSTSTACASGMAFCVRQFESWAAAGDNPGKRQLTFKAPVLAGSTVLVLTSDMNILGTPIGSGTPVPLVITDSENGAYKALLTFNDQIDWQDIQIFARSNLPAGAITVQTAWPGNQWHSTMIVEVAGAATNPVIKSAGAVLAGAKGRDVVSSGPLSLGDSPALLLGLGFNVSDYLGDVGAPYVGAGFTAVTTAWNWNGAEGTSLNDTALLEAGYFTHPGNLAATFIASATQVSNSNVVAIAVSFQ